MELSESDFQRFASVFGEGCICIGSTITQDGIVYEIPDFRIEGGQIMKLSKVEVEAELIRMNHQESPT
jgi:hypothetical protein